MNNTQSTKSSGAAQTVSTAPCGCGCGCHGDTHTSGCCRLTCFERPSYFCGQLLSDADLTLQENYFREKNKLYHRTIDGFGVVCGLRMRCEPNCNGRITISDGYAIDCCGNDMIVCEQRTFDVIGALRKKKWLLERRKEPCKDEEYDRGCITKQCFYIGICYSEEPADYVTPYNTDCSPAPGPCQPTRVREGVRFEIYDKLPVRPDPLNEMEKRIERCFRIFREGQFSRGLEKIATRILNVLDCTPGNTPKPQDPDGQGPREREGSEAHCVFQECRALFLYELRTCPDQYNCGLEHEVCKLRPPARDNNDEGPSPDEAFKRLFELIQQHVFSCVLNELAFLCPDPPENCCVLIGSVEIENGRLSRVINYPRWYLWCFANFFEVLVYTLATDAACRRAEDDSTVGKEETHKHKQDGCCPSFQVDVCDFLNLFQTQPRASEFAANSFVRALKEMYTSVRNGFDFMQAKGFSPKVLNGLPVEKAQKLAEKLHIPLNVFDQPSAAESDPLSTLLENLIYRGPDPLVVENTRDKMVTRAARSMGAPARAVGPFSYDDFADLKKQVGQSQVSELTARLEKLEAAIAKLPTQPPAPAPEGGTGEPH
jgi:hypothetical protein